MNFKTCDYLAYQFPNDVPRRVWEAFMDMYEEYPNDCWLSFYPSWAEEPKTGGAYTDPRNAAAKIVLEFLISQGYDGKTPLLLDRSW